MIRICLLLVCLFACGCSVIEPRSDETLSYPQLMSRDEPDSLPSYWDCPACYAHESPFEKRMKPVVKGVEDTVAVVLAPFQLAFLGAVFVLSGFQPII